ncbi:WXG100 family type VII secretion target [Saccharopolyspora cebuensis]|uniref:ESAT-6-like protein n=1 Tax=Saccharopolyspora cebuensis TaxID=418759 RepID=A0ABV4CHI2_9PSEU
MSDYGVNFSAAMTASADLNSVNSKVRATIDSLIADVDKSTADWTGDAKMQYSDAKVLWNQQAAEMNRALGTAQQALNQIIELYQQTEKTNGAVWRA